MVFTTSSRMFLSETSFLFLCLSTWRWRIQVPPSKETNKTHRESKRQGFRHLFMLHLGWFLARLEKDTKEKRTKICSLASFCLSQYIFDSDLAPTLKGNLENRKRHFEAKLKFYWASSEENLNVHIMNWGKLYNKGPCPLYIPLFYPGSLFSNNHYPKSTKFILFYSISQRFWKASFL